MSSLKIKPCPNCGGEAYVIKALSQFRVTCDTKECIRKNTGAEWHKTRRDAIKAWNSIVDKT